MDVSAAARVGLPPPRTGRLPLIDAAKGVGIVLIVLGHNTWFIADHNRAANFLQSFLLPFFFIVSGVTFTVRPNLARIMLERADAWLKPCAVVLLAMGLWRIRLGLGDADDIALGLLYATGFTMSPVPLWFLPHLWLVHVAATLLLSRWPRVAASAASRALLPAALLIGGYLLLAQFDGAARNPACRDWDGFSLGVFACGLPYSADLLPLTLAYFLLGHFLAASLKAFRVTAPLLLASAAGLLALSALWGYSLDFNYRRYDHLLISTLQALCGATMLLCLCGLLARWRPLAAVLAYVGRGSLFVLLLHLPLMNKAAGVLSRLRLGGYGLSPQASALLSVAVATAVALLLWEACRRSRLGTLLMLPVLRPRRPDAPFAADAAPGRPAAP